MFWEIDFSHVYSAQKTRHVLYFVKRLAECAYVFEASYVSTLYYFAQKPFKFCLT